MQYYKPAGDYFVGDCMPFFHDGVFRLYYLLDHGHHGDLGGLGGHQWAQASTTDLVHWTHHPLALPISDESEGSICTGSVFFWQGTYYAFYATRLRDWKQHASLATSTDGVHFTKAGGILAAPPDGYSAFHYRDPVVIRQADTGEFRLLITAERENHPIAGRGGCLDHLVSRDLSTWRPCGPLILPGFHDVPECPDYFFWNGWYYLVFSNGGVARYRMSRQPLGPWERPAMDLLDGGASRVMKTAAFGAKRRIGVSWIGMRADDQDRGGLLFGGNAVFRELVQHADGSLGTRPVPEMQPPARETFMPTPVALTNGAQGAPGRVKLEALLGMDAAAVGGLPRDFRLTAEVSGVSGPGVFGLRLRRDGKGADSGYDLCLDPTEGTVRLHGQGLTRVTELRRPIRLEVTARGSIIDVCIDERRCVVDRCPEQQGDGLLFYAWNAAVTFANIRVMEL